MDITVKQCVGCGVQFPCTEEDTENVLYCSSFCEHNHSLIDESISN